MSNPRKHVGRYLPVAGGVLVAALVLVSVQGRADQAKSEDKETAGWPMMHAHGDYAPVKSDVELVEKAKDIRLAWNGPEHLGFAKTSSGGFKYGKYTEPAGIEPFNSGTATPIVAEGMVFHSYFHPTGGVLDEGRYKNKPHGYRAISADDVLIAIDAKTGKQKWKAVEKDKGVNRGGRKRVHWGVSPACADGVVYSMGSTGRLYAYRASDGTRKWESDIGPAHEKYEQIKVEALKEKKRVVGDSWKTSLVVAEGVLVATDGWNGLMGFETATGKRIWHARKVNSTWATPAIWRKDGREYLLVCTREGELRLLDPRDGKELWKEKVGVNYPTLVLHGDIAICNVKQAGEKDSEGVYGGIRISTEGIKRLWSFPEEVNTITNFGGADNAATRWLAIRDDLAILCRKTTPRSGRSKYDIMITVLKPETGEILYRRLVTEKDAPEKASKRVRMPILMGDYVMLMTDQNHGNSGYGGYYYHIERNDDGTFKTLTYAGQWPKRHFALTGYETPIEIPYVGGRLYFRSMKGIACYDLRKQTP